ncbi:hypothetical protein ACFL1H_07170, partial [Nanoarchaeota archaeon]
TEMKKMRTAKLEQIVGKTPINCEMNAALKEQMAITFQLAGYENVHATCQDDKCFMEYEYRKEEYKKEDTKTETPFMYYF